ncbi:MAG TPA: UPF0236 family protein [Dehalococcoidia bacterium]|nr:UPF0236 family protein [Dehalococcoidia bacterium]
MPTVQVTVTLSIPEGSIALEALEEEIAQVVEAAGRQLLLRACKAMEAAHLQRQAASLRRDKQRPLDLLTRFGWVRLMRWQVRGPDGGYHRPLDELVGLHSHQHASPWITSQAVALATRLPYRQAAHLLSNILQTPIDHRSLYGWVCRAGVKVVVDEDERHQAVFTHGQLPPADPRQREIVLAEVDGTFLRAQREEAPEFEVRLGVLTSGKALESLTAKHRRYRLLERVRYGGVESAGDFGERLFLAGEARLGLSRAQHLLLVGDGADWIEALAGHDRWRATYQLDWWHLGRALHRTFPDHPQLRRRLQTALYAGDGQHLIRLVRLAQSAGRGDPQRLATLLTYLQTNQGGFYGARSLRPRLSEQAQLVCLEGSGAVEKHIDLAICRRFKGQGMRWSRAGANRLLKLRLRELDAAA